MALFLLGVLALLAGGTCYLLLPVPWKNRSLLFLSLTAFILVLIPSFIVLFSNQPFVTAAGALSLRSDAVSSFFQMMIGSVFFLSILFVFGYFKVSNGRLLFFMTMAGASFLLLTVASNSVQFLLVWQALILTFGFASRDGTQEKNIFTRYQNIIGFETGFLFIAAGLIVLACSTGGIGFADLKKVVEVPSVSFIVFILLAAGFSITAAWPYFSGKSSGDPLVSLFSVLITAAGSYGLLRTVSWSGDSAGMWAVGTLILLSAVFAVRGAVVAVKKNDLSSFLSFSGTMNFGLTGLAAGLGMMGTYYGNTMMAVSGFSAALFQVVNHVIARTLILISGIRSVSGGKVPLDRPVEMNRTKTSSAIFFFIGSLAMIGLPMLNGMMNFFLGSFGIASQVGKDPVQASLLVVLMAGSILPVLLLFSFFSKIYPRLWLSGKTKKTGKSFPAVSTGLACVFLTALVFATGIFPQYIAIFSVNPAADLANTVSSYTDHGVMSVYSRIFNSLNMVSKTLLTFAGLAIILYLVRLFVLTKKDLEASLGEKAPARRRGR